MKVFLVGILISFNLFAQTTAAPPHIGPEGLRFNKLHILKVEKLIENRLSDKNLKAVETEEAKELEMLLAVGKKASQWIEVVNANRETNKLDLSNVKKTGGIPITTPNITNTAILMQKYSDFLKKTTPLITDVITSSQNYPTNPPVSDLEFVNALRVLDRIYQGTVRWAGASKWLDWYANRAIYDVRGYIFLKETPNLADVLKTYPEMSKEDQAKYTGLLLGLCRNGDFEASDCLTELAGYVKRNTLYGFYTKFSKYGKSMYDLFFTVKNTRPEVYWNDELTVLFSPFQTPKQDDVRDWLKLNVDDEWRGVGFNLTIEFQNSSSNPRIQFKEGVTANVNGIGGNLITMSTEYPINTIDQKYTIRHEYGHVLGFEDCYLEFYDNREKAMIYYEIDVDNLMCSRNGHIKDTHIEQLKKSYNKLTN
ncbi:MAG: hypothetical protein K2Q18_11110 [Bdellovibrionales bacterium]|nr:hypothetical protein [Bdellovibrionales bacterium]